MKRSLVAARTALIAQSLLWAVVLSMPGCNNPGSGNGASGNQPGVNVSSKTPQSIQLTAGSTTIPIGASLQFSASVSYTDGTTSDQATGLTWTSSAPKVMTIDGSGLATAVALGTATITASDPVSGATGTLAMTVSSAALSMVTVDPATGSVPLGATVLLTASGTWTDGTTRALLSGVTWTSTNPAIASVDDNGLVTGVAPGGPVTISASFQGQGGRAKITTTSAVLNTITVTPASPSLAAGTTVQLSATGNYSDGTSPTLMSGVSWQSSDATIASVDPATGKVTGMTVGTATISAAFGGQTGNTSVTVTSAVVQTVIVTPAIPPSDTTTTPPPPPPVTTTPVSVAAGLTAQLIAYITLSDGTQTTVSDGVTWTSSDTTIATVNSTGVVKGLATGTVSVTAAYGGQSSSDQVTVTPALLVSVSVPPVADAPKGTTVQLTASGNYSDGTSATLTPTAVTWSSSDTTVAIVNSTGLVTGISPGTASITATFSSQSVSIDVTIDAARLTAIGVTPNGAPIPKGLTAQLSANGAYSDGSSLALTSGVTWSSSDNTIATVSGTGLVTGVGAGGTVTITASMSGVSSSVQVTVTAAVLDHVVVSPSSASVAAGLAVQLSASGIYSDGTSQALTSGVTWTSSNLSVATVTGTGAVSGVAAGTATITATYGGKSASSAITVTAPSLVSVTVNPTSPSIPAGLTVQLTATGNFTDGSGPTLVSGVTWTSSNTGVATVSSTGIVTGVSAGAVTITASYGGASGASSVTVTAAVLQSVSVSPASASVAAGQTVQLKASGNYSNGTSTALSTGVTWTSSSTSVATVDGTGLVKGVAAGTAYVTASFGGVASTAVPVTVTGQQLLSVSVSPSAASVPEGRSVQLTAYGTYTDGTTQALSSGVTWSSSNTRTATVSSTGLVTGREEGTATITASYGGTSGAATVTVTEHEMSSISITPANVSLAAGLTIQLNVVAGMSDNTAITLSSGVTWTSDNLNVATVGSNGLVTGVSPGTAKITASVGKNSDTTNVIVTAAQLQSVSVSPASTSVAAGTTVQLAAKAGYSDGSKVLLASGVTWSTSNAPVATVSSSGVVSGVATGSVTITATYGGIGGSAAVSVTPALLQGITVTPASASVSAGSTATLTATGSYSDGSKVTLASGVSWTSDTPAVATVNSAGVVTGVAAGSATITASFGGAVGAAIVTVPQQVLLRSLLITAPSGATDEDSSMQMTAYGVYSDGSTAALTAGVVWTSSNLRVATVNGSGLLTGVDEGTVTITAKDSASGISTSVNVTITEEEDNDHGGGGKGKGSRHSRINRWW